MNCANHAEVRALASCAACAEAFCENCLVPIGGAHYCASCKVETVKSLPAPIEGLIPCKEAGEALRLAIFSIFCFGVILGPVAMAKANRAKRLLEANPQLSGSGKVIATYLVASMVILFWVFGMLGRIAKP